MNFFRFLIGVLCLTSALFGADSVGKIIAVEGKVKANGRNLSRGSSVFVADVIDVDPSSKVQIKFTDGGLVSLNESTQYRIDSYQFKSDNNESSASLLKGGFRAVSGSIAEKNPDGVSVKTPVATIGIRGTDFGATASLMGSDFGCFSGKISIRTISGDEKELNPGQFISADASGTLGSVSNVAPSSLLFSAPGKKEESTNQVQKLEVRSDEGNPPCK